MRRSPFVFFAVLLGLCAFVAAWHNRASSNGAMALPAGASVGAMSPLLRGFNGVGAWASDVGRAVFQRGSSVEENARLKARVAEVEAQNTRLVALSRENENLRRLLKAPTPSGGKRVAASIVAFDATDTSRELVLNVGARQGVREKDTVFASEGVVGQIKSVGPTVCRVSLPTALGANIGAKVARSGAAGVLEGSGETLCRLQYLSDSADVREGDTVVTSGLVSGKGQIYPGGFPLGRVSRVRRNPTLSQTEALVEPFARAENLSAVWVRTAS